MTAFLVVVVVVAFVRAIDGFQELFPLPTDSLAFVDNAVFECMSVWTATNRLSSTSATATDRLALAAQHASDAMREQRLRSAPKINDTVDIGDAPRRGSNDDADGGCASAASGIAELAGGNFPRNISDYLRLQWIGVAESNDSSSNDDVFDFDDDARLPGRSGVLSLALVNRNASSSSSSTMTTAVDIVSGHAALLVDDDAAGKKKREFLLQGVYLWRIGAAVLLASPKLLNDTVVEASSVLTSSLDRDVDRESQVGCACIVACSCALSVSSSSKHHVHRAIRCLSSSPTRATSMHCAPPCASTHSQISLPSTSRSAI